MYFIINQDFESIHAIDYDFPDVWRLNRYRLFRCEPIDPALPVLKFYINKTKNLPDLLPNEKNFLLINQKLQDILNSSIPENNIQYIKIEVIHKKSKKAIDGYVLANILNEVDAINHEKSNFVYDHNGYIKFVKLLVIDESKTKNQVLFRLKGCNVPVLIREDLMQKIIASDCTGIKFIEPKDFRL